MSGEEVLRIKPQEAASLIAEGRMQVVTAAPEPKGYTNSSLERAGSIFGQDCVGPRQIEETLGIRIPDAEIPPLPYSEEELQRAKELDQFLILRVSKDASGKPLTMERFNEIVQPKLEESDEGQLLYNTSWYSEEEFFKKDTPDLAWALVSKEVIPSSTNQNYLEQTQAIADYLKEVVFKNKALPDNYKEAIEEFEQGKDAIEAEIESDWQGAAKKLSALRLNQITRQKPVEAIYDLATYFLHTDERLMEGMYAWTNTQSSYGRLVYVGRFVSKGVYVRRWDPGRSA